MKTRPVLISLLIAAHVSVAMAVVAGLKLPVAYGDWLPLAVVATAQIGLLSIWTALGRRATPWRPAVLIAAIVAWSWIEAMKHGGETNWFFVFLPIAAATMAIFLVARLKGVRLGFPDDDPGKKQDRWQFTLQSLFAWTTSIAFCLGLVIFALRNFRLEQNARLPEEIFITSGFVVAVITASTYFAWMKPRLSYTLCSIIYAIGVVLLFVYWCFGLHFFRTIVVYSFLEMVFLVATHLVLRIAGCSLEIKKTGSQLGRKTGKDTGVTLYGL